MKRSDSPKTEESAKKGQGISRSWQTPAVGALLCVVLFLFLSLTVKKQGTAEEQPDAGKAEVSAEETVDENDGRGASLPEWIEWKDKEIILSGDASGKAERKAVLSGKKVKSGEWESPEGCLIQDMLVCDIDSDGQDELMLLLWKVGTNIDLKLWNEEGKKGWDQHIYIFDIREDDIVPIWWASEIGLTADTWEFNEKRRLIIHEHSGMESCWDWDGFGLKMRSEVTFMATGDLMIHKAVYDRGLRSGEGFSFLFDEIRTDMEETDVNILQQETVLVNDPDEYSSFPRFGSPVEVGEEVVRSGFDVVELATNHMLDKGYEAVDLTAGLYDENNVMYIGAQPSSKAENEPYKILVRQGIRFALFNYTFSTNGQPVPEEYPNMIHTLFDEEKVKEELKKGKQDSDFVIVFVHWGTEYSTEIDEFQKKWSEIFMDCGVNVVVGSHPHVIQSMELIKRDGQTMLCYYSLGNLISTMDEEGTQTGGLAKFTVLRTTDGCRLAGYELKEIDSSF